MQTEHQPWMSGRFFMKNNTVFFLNEARFKLFHGKVLPSIRFTNTESGEVFEVPEADFFQKVDMLDSTENKNKLYIINHINHV